MNSFCCPARVFDQAPESAGFVNGSGFSKFIAFKSVPLLQTPFQKETPSSYFASFCLQLIELGKAASSQFIARLESCLTDRTEKCIEFSNGCSLGTSTVLLGHFLEISMYFVSKMQNMRNSE